MGWNRGISLVVDWKAAGSNEGAIEANEMKARLISSRRKEDVHRALARISAVTVFIGCSC
jgi:hypothetical protein